jgi:hypothetical protein
MEYDKVGDAISDSFTPEEVALSDSEKAEVLADSLEAQFQSMDYPSDPAVIEMVNEAMRVEYALARKPKLTSPSEVLQAIKGPKVSKAPGPNDNPNRVLRHLPKCATTFLPKVFDAVLRRQYFPPARKHVRVISKLKPKRTPRCPLPIDKSVGKLFEKILLTIAQREVNERGLLRDEQFGFRPRHITLLKESTETFMRRG